MLDNFDGERSPRKSRAQRDIQAASRGHCTAHTVLGDGTGVHVQAESWLELCNLYLLNARRDVKELREQQIFWFGWDRKNPEKHVFDVVAYLTSGARVAYTVKPERRLLSKPGNRNRNGERYDDRTFIEKMGIVTWWATVETGEYDEVVLVTEADINQTDLRNARMFAAVREPDAEADAVALDVVRALPMSGGCPLRDLTLETGMAARGYRALIRLLRRGILRPVRHEVIGPTTIVRLTEGF